MKTLLASLALALTIPLSAQPFSSSNLPDAPVHHIDRTELALVASVATVRLLDYQSTWRAVHAPCHCAKEDELPNFVVEHRATLLGFEAGMVALEYMGSRELAKHGHRRMAKIVLAVDLAGTLPTVIHNYSIPLRMPPLAAPSSTLGQPVSGAILPKRIVLH